MVIIAYNFNKIMIISLYNHHNRLVLTKLLNVELVEIHVDLPPSGSPSSSASPLDFDSFVSFVVLRLASSFMNYILL